MNRILRNFFLFLAKSKWLKHLAKRYGLRFGAARFIAGTNIEDAAIKIKELNDQGLVVTIDHLGEFIESKEEALQSKEECIHAINVIAKEGLDAELSLKLTSLGLDISTELVMDSMREILDVGKKHQITITIDMEDYARCERTLEVFKILKREYSSIGTVIQAYLYRSKADINELNILNPYLRLVKGAYNESQKVAFPEKTVVDDNYKKLIQMNLLEGNYTAIATHDENIINYVILLEKEYELSKHNFEFQMLFGIRTKLQEELASKGYKMRVYVPYGKDWYGYNMRRLAERPANVAFVIRSLFER